MKTPTELREHSVSTLDMVNENYEPSENEEAVLDVMREEWRANPMLIREQTGLGKGATNTALTRLTSAGWVRKVTRGLYEFVEDPRSSDTTTKDQTVPESGGEDQSFAVAAMSFEEAVTDRRLAVLEEWLTHASRVGSVQKSDFEEWYTTDHQDRTGYNTRSFWEVFAKPGLRQADGFSQPNTRTYRWEDG